MLAYRYVYGDGGLSLRADQLDRSPKPCLLLLTCTLHQASQEHSSHPGAKSPGSRVPRDTLSPD